MTSDPSVTLTVLKFKVVSVEEPSGSFIRGHVTAKTSSLETCAASSSAHFWIFLNLVGVAYVKAHLNISE